MFSIGTPELLVLLVIAFIVFGPKQLPRVARAVGRLVGEWRKLTGDVRKTIEDEALRVEEPSQDKKPRTKRKRKEAAHGGKPRRSS